MLPLYEAKMVHYYDTKWATYEPDGSTRDVTPDEKRDPDFVVMPRYWVHEDEVDRKLDGKWDESWMLGWRWIARSTDERTFVCATLPILPAGNSLPLAIYDGDRSALTAVWSSICFDYVARQKLGGANMTFGTTEQLPVPLPEMLAPYMTLIADHVDRLNAQRLDSAANARLRAELDALMFRVYGVSHEDADYILETFPIRKRKEIAAYGEYRTKRFILEAYDRLREQP